MALATTTADGGVQALIGRSEGCRPDVNPLCSGTIQNWLTARPGLDALTATNGRVVVATSLPATTTVSVKATRFSASSTTYAGGAEPTPSVNATAKVAKNGTVSLTLPGVVDGDAWLVQISR